MKVLIFDFDGTLADSFALALDIAYELTGIGKASDAQLEKLRQLPLVWAIWALRIPVVRMPRLLFKGRQRMHERLAEVRPFENMPAVLAELHARGYEMHIMSSNSETNVRAFLQTNHLEQYFTSVAGNASIINKARALKRVMRRLAAVPEQCFYVGDEIRDMVAAAYCGVGPVGVTWGFQAPVALEKTKHYAIAYKPHDLLKIFPSNKEKLHS